MRLGEEQSGAPRARIVAGRMARLAAGAVTLEGTARAAVELAAQLTHRAVALGIAAGEPGIIAISNAADKRLGGIALPYTSAGARERACCTRAPTRGGQGGVVGRPPVPGG